MILIFWKQQLGFKIAFNLQGIYIEANFLINYWNYIQSKWHCFELIAFRGSQRYTLQIRVCVICIDCFAWSFVGWGVLSETHRRSMSSLRLLKLWRTSGAAAAVAMSGKAG